MAGNSLEQRVLAIEQMLQDYATHADIARLEQQILQLRADMHGEFSAVRTEVRGEFSAVRAEMSVLRGEMHEGDQDVRGLIEQRTAEILTVVAAGDEETRRILREEIRSNEDETRRLMRVLHEEVIARIDTISRG